MSLIMMKKKLINIHNYLVQYRYVILIKVLAFFFIVGHLSSFKLWITARVTPVVPMWSWVPILPQPWDYGLFVVYLILMLGILLLKDLRLLSFLMKIVFSMLVLLIVLDETRLNSWIFQFLGILFFLTLGLTLEPGGKVGPIKEKMLLCCQWIVTAIYFWGGVNKINYNYIYDVFPWFSSPLLKFPWLNSIFFDHSGLYPKNILYVFSVLSFLSEIVISIGLWFPRFRYFIATKLFILHFLIVYCLSPWGLDYGHGAISWNFAMIIFCYLLFFTKEEKKITKQEKSKMRIPSWCVRATFTIYLILPVGNLFDLWDSYLSFCMFSGSTKSAKYYFSEESYKVLSKELRPYFTKISSDFYQVNFTVMAFKEFQYSAVPEIRHFQKIKKHFCDDLAKKKKSPREEPLLLLTEYKPNIFNGKRQYTIENCQGIIIKSGEH
jgi:hypothetical protein